MSTQPNPAPSNTSSTDHPGEQLVTIRRAPSMLAFAITGVILGLLLATLITFIPWPTGSDAIDTYATEYSVGSVYGIMAVVCAALGAGVMIVIALILDRRSAKNPEKVRALPAEDTE